MNAIRDFATPALGFRSRIETARSRIPKPEPGGKQTPDPALVCLELRELAPENPLLEMDPGERQRETDGAGHRDQDRREHQPDCEVLQGMRRGDGVSHQPERSGAGDVASFCLEAERIPERA